MHMSVSACCACCPAVAASSSCPLLLGSPPSAAGGFEGESLEESESLVFAPSLPLRSLGSLLGSTDVDDAAAVGASPTRPPLLVSLPCADGGSEESESLVFAPSLPLRSLGSLRGSADEDEAAAPEEAPEEEPAALPLFCDLSDERPALSDRSSLPSPS